MIQRNRAWRRREARHAADEAAQILDLRPTLAAKAAKEGPHPHAKIRDLRLFWSTEQDRRDAA